MRNCLVFTCFMLCLIVFDAESRQKITSDKNSGIKTVSAHRQSVYSDLERDSSATSKLSIPPHKNINAADWLAIPTVDLRDRCRNSLQRSGTISEKLYNCPAIAQKVEWQLADGRSISYPDWPEEKKNRLEYFLNKYLRNEEALGLLCERPDLPLGSLPSYFHENDAFDIYAAQVAHVFFVEENRMVPWSILSWPIEEIAYLLNSNSLFSIIVDRSSLGTMPTMEGYRPGTDYQLFHSWTQDSAPCDPRKAYAFFVGAKNNLRRNLIGSTPDQSLDNLSLWAAKNLIHGEGVSSSTYFLHDRLSSASMDYRGRTVQKIIVNGCASSAALFLELLRSINVPVLPVLHTLLPPEQAAAREGVLPSVIPSISFPSFTHFGLVFHWATSNPKILVHMDELYAYEVNPFWGIRDRRTVLSESETAHLFFENMWRSRDSFSSLAFNINPNFSEIHIGEDGVGRYYINSSGIIMTHDNTIRFLGYYQLTEGTPSSSFASNAVVQNRFIQKFAMCSWNDFLNIYCDSPSDFEVNMRILSRYEHHDSRMPLPSPGEFSVRAEICLSALGGYRVSGVGTESVRVLTNIAHVDDWFSSGLANAYWRD